MSLVKSAKKLKLIPVAKCGNETVYFDPSVLKDKRVKKLTFDDEYVEPIPYLDLKHDQRSMVFIASISGSGKSHLAAKLVKRYREIHKDKERKLYVFTITKTVDPVFESDSHLAWIPLEHEEFPLITPEMLKDSIVLFDDWSSLTDPKLRLYVQHFIQDIAERSRKLGIDLLIIGHQLQANQQTKAVIFESDTYCLNFNTSINASMKFCSSYCDLSKDELALIKDATEDAESPFEFTTIRKSYPRMIISSKRVMLI